MFLIILNVQKDSLSYNWYNWIWIWWTCTSYESILIVFFLLFVNTHHWLDISAIYSKKYTNIRFWWGRGSDTHCACGSMNIKICIMFVLFVWRMESINYVLTLVIHVVCWCQWCVKWYFATILFFAFYCLRMTLFSFLVGIFLALKNKIMV
jgi:hypothetical protein